MEKEVKSTSVDYLERHRQRKEFEEQQAKKIDDFLLSHSPKVIANKLKKHIVGQDELIKAVAEFYYYQVLRFKYPLPSRPMMIFGPSGSGKTEVWRIISKLFPDILRICIVDASRITSDGWRGDLKVASFMKPYMSHGILVFDECDKLFSPRFDAHDTNISAEIQGEFLKIIEEETYIIPGKTLETQMSVERVGVVFVGAFENIRMMKETPQSTPIGFNSQTEKISHRTISREDFIEYGIIPELLGRISKICKTKSLSTEQYLEIVRNENSRIGIIANFLAEHGIDAWEGIDDAYILELIKKSNTNVMGVRAVISKIENIMVSKLFEHGIYPSKIPDNTPEHTP